MSIVLHLPWLLLQWLRRTNLHRSCKALPLEPANLLLWWCPWHQPCHQLLGCGIHHWLWWKILTCFQGLLCPLCLKQSNQTLGLLGLGLLGLGLLDSTMMD